MTNLIESLFCIFIIVFIGVGIILYDNSYSKELPPVTYDHGSTYVIVNWYDTEQELQYALDDDELAGLSNCEHRPDFNTSFCELWLVLPEHYQDEYAFDTIGHEFYHAIKGNWHGN